MNMESVRNIIITIISMCFIRSRSSIFKYYIGRDEVRGNGRDCIKRS